MKFIVTFCLAALLISVSASAEDEVYQTIKKIESNKLGKTLIDTIQLQLQAGDPVEDLIHMLQETEEGLEKAQDEDDKNIEVVQKECDYDLATLDAEIKAAKKRIEQLTAELNEKIPIRDQKVEERAEKEKYKQLLEEKLLQIAEQKKLKDAEYQEEMQEHDQAQYVIERAKQVIVDAMKAPSFLQKGTVNLAQVSDHFTKHSKTNYKRQSWSQIFKILAHITSAAPIQADQSAVQKVVDLCDQLLDKIAQSREIERRDYQHWMDEYKQTKETLEAKLSELNAQIANLTQEINALNKRIQQCQIEKKEQEERVREKTEQYETRLKWCDDENVAYAKKREARNDEREVVSDAIGLLQSHLRLFRQYVSERLETIEKPQ